MKQTEDITDNEKTVVFRKHKESGALFAFFPLVPSAMVSGECALFHAQSGWGSSSLDDMLTETVPAIESEYSATLEALEKTGHGCTVRSYEEMLAFPNGKPARSWPQAPVWNEARNPQPA